MAGAAVGAAIAVESFVIESAAGAAMAGAAAGAAAESDFGASVLAPQAARANMAANVAIRFIGISPWISEGLEN